MASTSPDDPPNRLPVDADSRMYPAHAVAAARANSIPVSTVDAGAA